jgi:preprotein translocase subunit SecD
MQKNLTGKTILILAILAVFTFLAFGVPTSWNAQGIGAGMLNPIKVAGVSLREGIHLGLDLRGGSHFVLEVEVADALNASTDNDVARVETDFTKAGIKGAVVGKTDAAKHPELITISGISPDKIGAARDVLTGVTYSNIYDLSSNPDGSFSLTMKPGEVARIEDHAFQQSIETIRSRVDTLGVSEPVIQEYGLGKYEILVELPGVDDPARVKDIIQQTARLEIHQVVGEPYASESAALQALGSIPPDEELLHSADITQGANAADEVYLVKRVAEVGGSDIRDAEPSKDSTSGMPDVVFYLTAAAGDRFYDFTKANIGNKLAVVLENKVKEAAVIRDAIRDQGNITGGFTQQTASDLSMLLRTGALPASIHYLEERTVGPSLGADSIRQGVISAMAGMAAVMVFMLIYYRGSGINADLALFLNLIILLGFMGFTGSTLTLPGIAGVILTIGMGVDSNVLIFERIREEIRAGKVAATAVEQGFGHAWLTIIDTHVTTIVSAIILFMFGSGPVKGFAVTLSFGLFANLFTAVFVSRTIFDALLNKRDRGAALSI